jgi:hypothetical protein
MKVRHSKLSTLAVEDLQHGGEALQAHSCVHAFSCERPQFSFLVPLVLHEDQIPYLQPPFSVHFSLQIPVYLLVTLIGIKKNIRRNTSFMNNENRRNREKERNGMLRCRDRTDQVHRPYSRNCPTRRYGIERDASRWRQRGTFSPIRKTEDAGIFATRDQISAASSSFYPDVRRKLDRTVTVEREKEIEKKQTREKGNKNLIHARTKLLLG